MTGGAGFTPVFPIPTFNTAVSRSAVVDPKVHLRLRMGCRPVSRRPTKAAVILYTFFSKAKQCQGRAGTLRFPCSRHPPFLVPLRRNAVSTLVGTTLQRDLRFENGVRGGQRPPSFYPCQGTVFGVVQLDVTAYHVTVPGSGGFVPIFPRTIHPRLAPLLPSVFLTRGHKVTTQYGCAFLNTSPHIKLVPLFTSGCDPDVLRFRVAA